ncbi:MAG: flagellar filament capping protein FliD [Comamonadaceae bacterium]|jgi:flagellar hook-associated protein 2|nr:flagellar filament capping protein FliD [Comamonadaceae bacterium]
MATISSLGLGSGLDVESIISKLVSLDQQPIANLNKKTSGLKTQLSTYGQIQSALSTLRDTSAKLTNPDTWAGTKASVSDATAISVTASSGAAIGNVSIQVDRLAQAQSLASGSFANATSTVGQGTLTIELGSWDATGTAFTSKAGKTPVTITIGPGQDQLGQIRDQINAANAGVVAAVVTDASGSRLTLTSRDTGETNAFRVTVDDADGNAGDAAGLSQLAYDPSSSITRMSLTLPAVNARAKLNGLDISSETNSLSAAIDGLNILLLKTTPPVTISVNQDVDAIKKAVSDFTAAYNALNQLLRSQTKYDAATKTAAPLQGDSSAVSLTARLRGIAGGGTSLGGSLSRLADIGLAPGADGNLAAAGTKLDKALANNLADLKSFFMGVDNTDANNSGFATRFRTLVDQALSVDGTVTTRQKGIQTLIDNNNKRVDQLTDRSAANEARLRAQYAALDTKMGQLSSLSNYMNQQIAQFNK